MKELDYYAKLLELGKVSRREFIGRAMALGATTALATTMAGKALRAATPKQGGTLRIAIAEGTQADSLDPATIGTNYELFVGYGMRNHLTEISSTDELVPELCESWDASDDAVTWTFKLRKGIEFHNGKTMDADDVVASFNHHRGEDSKSAAKPLLEPIVEIKADGKDTVVFTLAGGNADFPYIASDYHIPIMPAKNGGVDWESGTGTGGYILESYDPNVRATLKRNPNYWKEGRAHFEGSEVLTVIDSAARTNALITGEVDVISRVELKTAHLLELNPDVRLEETNGGAHYTVPMRTDTPPFDDNNVRMALKLSLDRDALLRAVLRGHGVLGNDHPIGLAYRYHATEDELPQRVYDPDKAKWHLKQAGLSSLKVDLSAADAAFAGGVDAAVLYKEHAAKAGIDITVIREPNDGYWDAVWMQKPWSMSYWDGRPTEDLMFLTPYAAGAPWNETFWKHPRFNELLVAARGELDQAKRREMYVEMQRITRDEGGAVVPMFNNHVFAMSTKMQHDDEMAANWTLDGNKGIERWWFA
jgi:peptide/nickel transport system substrate-binding protein